MKNIIRFFAFFLLMSTASFAQNNSWDDSIYCTNDSGVSITKVYDNSITHAKEMKSYNGYTYTCARSGLISIYFTGFLDFSSAITASGSTFSVKAKEIDDLYWAIRTRVLTPDEMKRVRELGTDLIPNNSTDVTTQFNTLLYNQAMLQIAQSRTNSILPCSTFTTPIPAFNTVIPAFNTVNPVVNTAPLVIPSNGITITNSLERKR